jgi:hypothetical protein
MEEVVVESLGVLSSIDDYEPSPMYVARLIPSMLRKTEEKVTSIPTKKHIEKTNTALTACS